MRKRFAAVRIAHGTKEVIRSVGHADTPVIVVMNHASWWDPLLGLVIAEEYFGDRPCYAPMEMEQWQNFKFMRKLGVFGVNTSDPDAFTLTKSYINGLISDNRRSVLMITPQAQFTDPRADIRLRPGAASIAAANDEIQVISLAVEYGFWDQQRPEVFLRATNIDTPEIATTAGWHRALQHGMKSNGQYLAQLVINRDSSAFVSLIGKRGADVNPIYDAAVKLRGRSASVRSEKD
ncbi:MAG: lysophospholipid acyltransferase family protein [Phycisphaerales bacterium]